MTDKQIIIDVCPYQGECSVSGCKRNDDGCFVRQLFKERYRAENQIVELNKTIKAKEQECEQLKITIEENSYRYAELDADFEQSKKECEKLKKQYNCYSCGTCNGKEDYINLKRHCENAIKSLHNKQAELDQLKAENEELKKAYARLNSLYNDNCDFTGKLEKTLTEIKEIAQYDVYTSRTDLCLKLNWIKKKISEVENV